MRMPTGSRRWLSCGDISFRWCGLGLHTDTLRSAGRGAGRGFQRWKGCWKGGVPFRKGGGFRRWKGGTSSGRGVLAGVPARVPTAEGGSSIHIQGFQLHCMVAMFIYQLRFVPQATLDVWLSLFLVDGICSEEAEVVPKVEISVKGVVAKPQGMMLEIGGEVDTQAIMWPATAGVNSEDWSQSFFLKGKTN